MDLQKIMAYMLERFPESLNCDFTYALLENIIFDVCTQYGEELAPQILFNIIPHIEKEELVQLFNTED